MWTNLNITCTQKEKQRSARIPAALTKETAIVVPRARELGLVTGPPSKGPPSTGPRGTRFCVWLLSLSITPGKSVCAMAWSTPLLFLITVEYAGHTVVSLSVRWLLDYWVPAHVGEVVNSAALEGLVHALWWTYLLISCRYTCMYLYICIYIYTCVYAHYMCAYMNVYVCVNVYKYLYSLCVYICVCK